MLSTSDTPDNLLHFLQGEISEVKAKASLTVMETDKGGIRNTFLSMFEHKDLFQECCFFSLFDLGRSHLEQVLGLGISLDGVVRRQGGDAKHAQPN